MSTACTVKALDPRYVKAFVPSTEMLKSSVEHAIRMQQNYLKFYFLLLYMVCFLFTRSVAWWQDVASLTPHFVESTA